MKSLRFTLLLFFLILRVSIHSNSISQKAIICGICKDVADQIPTMKISMEMCGEMFQDYQIIIYENNSTDGTKEFLQTWAEENENVTVISEDYTKEELMSFACHSEVFYRVEVIAFARNKLLQEVMSPKYDSYKYVIMGDMDFSHLWPIKKIEELLNMKRPWDALFANGMASGGINFDMFAFRGLNHPIGPEVLGRCWWANTPTEKIDSRYSWVPVTCAFGGLGIYKRESMRNCEYKATVTRNLEKVTRKNIKLCQECNPNLYHMYLQQLNKLEKIYDEAHLTNKHPLYTGFKFDDEEESVTWIFDYHGPLFYPFCCEHLTFHADMIANGHGRLYVVPDLYMIYKSR